MKRIAGILSTLPCLIFLLSQPSFAGEGIYLGIDYVYNAIEGDFDDRDISLGPGDTLVAPLIDKGNGIGIHLGYRLPTNFSIELTYQQTSHDSKRGAIGFDVNHSELAGGIKYNFNAEGLMQPFVKFAAGVHVLEVEGGASNSGLVDDAYYSGVGLDIGAGIDFFFTKRVSLGLDATYQSIHYTDASGIIEEGKLSDELDGSGLSLNAGISFHF